MTRDEALMHLTVAYGHNPAVADFNISAVNYVLDSLIQTEREACAKLCEQDENQADDWIPDSRPGGHFAAVIRARGIA